MAINSTKKDEDLKEGIKREVLKRLFSLLTGYKKETTLVTVLICTTVAFGIFYPLIIQRMIDDEIYNKNIKGLLIWAGVLFVMAVLNMLLTRKWRKIMADVSNDIVLKLRRKLYTHIQYLGVDFFDSRPAGKILARVTGDINSLKDVLSSTITQLVPEILTIVAVLIVMVIVSPELTISALLTLPVILAGVFVCEILAHKRWQLMRKKDSNMTAFIHEAIDGVSVIQSFNAEKETDEEFEKIVNEHRKSFISAVSIADLFSPTIEISYGIGTIAMYIIAIKWLNLDAASVGELTAFTMYMGMLFGPIRNLANYYNKLVTNMSSAERVFEILDTEPLIKDSDDATVMPEIKGEVIFDDVTFAYPDEPDADILHSVSFAALPGETIALVGPTGAGKTTIVSLISRFYNTKSGRVLIDGNDISKVTVKSLRSQLGIMTQDNFLFSGSIKDNIKYGKKNATDEEVIAAAKAVHADEFISKLEKGYDTEITERGAGLSAGQRQLIAFARTLLTRPRILILDEATSSIDTQTEILVQEGIRELLKSQTSFVVAHRLSTIKNADRIFVIDDGGILEAGNHETLMAQKGAYYNLYMSQYIAAT